MMRFVVETKDHCLRIGNDSYPCIIGRNGAVDASEKREGDGCTPKGSWPIRGVLVRPDRSIDLPAHLPWRWVRPDDGWSDDPADPAYNQPIQHPHSYSAEHLWRSDQLYDAIILLGYNDAPPVPSRGSAIFLHLRGDRDTEGCVAVDIDAMNELLRLAQPDDVLTIV